MFHSRRLMAALALGVFLCGLVWLVAAIAEDANVSPAIGDDATARLCSPMTAWCCCWTVASAVRWLLLVIAGRGGQK